MSEGRAFCFDDLDELQDAYIQLEKVLLGEREDFKKLELLFHEERQRNVLNPGVKGRGR